MRVLFLGLGGVGQRHLRNLKALHPEAEVAALRHGGRVFEIGNDLKPDTDVDVEAKYGIHRVADMAAALAWKPDFAVVSSPSSLHVAQCTALVEAGVPVFVEKPLATDRDGLEDLYRLAEIKGVAVSVGYQLRHHPCVLRLRELLARSAVGKVQSVEIAVHSHMPSWHAYERPDQFYAGRKDLGGGVVLTEIHEIDLACWLFGRPRRVAAMGGAVSGLGLDVEDTVAATLDFGTFPAALMLSFVQNPPMRRFVVNGSAGRITLEIPLLRIVAQDAGGAEIDRLELPADFDRNTMFVAELDGFIRSLSGGGAPCGLAAVRDGQDTALAILDALASGSVVSVN